MGNNPHPDFMQYKKRLPFGSPKNRVDYEKVSSEKLIKKYQSVALAGPLLLLSLAVIHSVYHCCMWQIF